MPKVTLLAGGVGGAKMAEGFAALDDVDLTVIGNVADDDSFHGLWVSPDIDTVTYTLADLINRKQGWGVADEGLRALGVLETLGQDTWMTLGDKDLGLHIYRTMRRAQGDRPSQIASDIAKAVGVSARIVLPTDDRIATRVQTDQGELSFQEYFVRERCLPTVTGLWFDGMADAKPTPESIQAIDNAELICIAPSNPLVSIDPIVSIPGVHDVIVEAPAPVIAVSPLIAGKTVKGPAARMMAALDMEPTALGVGQHYQGLADCLVIDTQDEALADPLGALGLATSVTDIVMPSLARKQALAAHLLELAL